MYDFMNVCEPEITFILNSQIFFFAKMNKQNICKLE